VWQFEQGVEIGPWGLVTLALGLTPALTLELPLEPGVELGVELELELPVELPLEFPLDLEPAAVAAFTAELALGRIPLPGGCNAMPPSMGANPSAMVIIQRVRPIVFSVLSVCANPFGTYIRAEIYAKKPRLPAPCAHGRD
jgi:hypothetical protein